MKDNIFKADNLEKSRIRGIIEEVIATIREVEFAYIYGSFLGEGGFHDVDVAVYLTRTEDVDTLECGLSIASMLEQRIRLPMDVKVLNHAPNSFCYEVTRGDVVFSRNEEMRFNFVEKTWSEYLDYKYVAENIMHELAA